MKYKIIMFALAFLICMFIASIAYQLSAHVGAATNGYFWGIATMLSLIGAYVSLRIEK